MEVTKLKEITPRIESGALQFGDDWPGLFLRGDEAFFWQMEVESALKGNRNKDLVLQNLYQLFGLCRVTNLNDVREVSQDINCPPVCDKCGRIHSYTTDSCTLPSA